MYAISAINLPTFNKLTAGSLLSAKSQKPAEGYYSIKSIEIIDFIDIPEVAPVVPFRPALEGPTKPHAFSGLREWLQVHDEGECAPDCSSKNETFSASSDGGRSGF